MLCLNFCPVCLDIYCVFGFTISKRYFYSMSNWVEDASQGPSINHVDSFLVFLNPSNSWTILLNNAYVVTHKWSPSTVHVVYGCHFMLGKTQNIIIIQAYKMLLAQKTLILRIGQQQIYTSVHLFCHNEPYMNNE